MKYKINWLERKTLSTGKVKIDATLIDEAGVTIDKVTIWDSFPDFANLAPERTVEGDITVKQNGQYTNKTLNAPKTSGGGFNKSAMTEKLMDKKQGNIEKSQDRKEESIIRASCQRDATLLTCAFISKMPEDMVSGDIMKETWEKWHAWLTNKAELPF